MNVFDGIDAIPASAQKTIVSIGVFDGVPRGHQAVIARIVDWANALGAVPGVITFRFPPKTRPDDPAPLITSLAHRLLLFERFGLQFACILDFDAKVSAIPARDFVETILVGKLNIAGIVAGSDNRFGYRGEGDVNLLRTLGVTYGFNVDVIDRPLTGDRLISSSNIREAIRAGDIATAADMLGRPVSVYGTVVRGDGRGRTLGFPTANIDVGPEVRLPLGVYSTIVVFDDGRRLPAVTNIGFRPTFKPATDGQPIAPLIETHIPDFRDDLYGKKIEALFIDKLRNEMAFGSRDALAEQIRKDIDRLNRNVITELNK
ncbi:MAG: riboflavin biosynthesis protein RibF [Planctomycetota bacterium]